MDGQGDAPSALPPEKEPGTHCVGGWVGPRAGLDGCEKHAPAGIRSQYRLARSESLYRLPYFQPTFVPKYGGKAEVHPRTGHGSKEGEQRYSSTPSLTSALDRGGGSTPRPAAMPPGKTQYPLYRRLDEPQGRSGRLRKISPPPGFDTRTVQSYRVAIPSELHRPTVPKYSDHFSL